MDIFENMELFYEVFNADLPRQGPGDNESTKQAYSYLKNLRVEPYILDVGCGVGMQTLELARITNGKILALDNHQPFLDKLEESIKALGLTSQITIINRSMLDMDFNANTFDVIWSEGAVFIYGFDKALEDWQSFVKEGGYIVLSELCWFKDSPPKEICDFLMDAYPPLRNIEDNIKSIKNSGLSLISHFNIPDSSWTDNYFIPLERSINKVSEKYKNEDETLRNLDNFMIEIEMFRRYSEYYGYTFFIMRKGK